MTYRRGQDDIYNCNHHHPIEPDQEFVDFGTGRFVADKAMIPLLKALNEAGLHTRTHNFDPKTGNCFLGILIDDARVEIRKVNEIDANRDTFNGRQEMLILWRVPPDEEEMK